MNRRSRALPRVPVRTAAHTAVRTAVRGPARGPIRLPVRLALLFALLLGVAGPAAAADPGGTARLVPAPPGAGDRAGAVVTGRVTPADTLVAEDANGDFVLTVTNTGKQTAYNVRVLLDDGLAGNGVGSPDGRCLSRLDTASPADLWCELGALEPGKTATVGVHAYMDQCVWLDPDLALPPLHAPAFLWRIGYADEGRARVLNEPAPRWSC